MERKGSFQQGREINMKYIFSIILLFVLSTMLPSQSAHKLKRQADESYKKGDYQGSEEAYRKAQLDKKSSNGTFNLGNSIYNQERFEEAAKQYEDLANSPRASISDRSDAFHNLGNTYFNMQEFDKSVDSFKESLKLEPTDMKTKYNLAQALKQLKIQQQQEQQNQQQDQDEQEEQEEQDQQEDQQQQDQPQQEQEEQIPDDQQQQQQDLTKEEARQLLEIMEQEEKKVQEKLKKAQKGPNKSKKDW